MLSISMAYNVISCNKIGRNTQKIKIADFTMWIWLPSSEMTKNRQKNGSLDRDLLNSFLKVWYILDASRWILASRQFRLCVAKGGKGCFRLSYGCPKLTLFSQKKKQLKRGVKKNKHGHNFQNIAFKTHLHWIIVYDLQNSSVFHWFLLPPQKKSIGLVYPQFWCHRPSQ